MNHLWRMSPSMAGHILIRPCCFAGARTLTEQKWRCAQGGTKRITSASSTSLLYRQQRWQCRSFSSPRNNFTSENIESFLKSQLNDKDDNNNDDDSSSIEISTNPYDLTVHGKGESYHPVAPPWAVVTPSTTQHVVDILKICNSNGIPVIPYGAGTSVEGHVSALQGGISLDMTKLDSIELDSSSSSDALLTNPVAHVGAGVTRLRLNDELRHSGLSFTVDPGANATLGGMVACGASGTTAVRYGTMRDNVLGLTCILADGTMVKCGTTGGALKNSAGYDITSLMTGSEGTLGVITSVTVKLRPIPQAVMGAVSVFETLEQAADAVAALTLTGIPLARCELLDASSMRAFNKYNSNKANGSSSSSSRDGVANTVFMKELPTLFLEFHGPSEAFVEEQVRLTEAICVDDYESCDFEATSDEAKRKSLWAARHDLYYASIWLREGATGAIVTDSCVPISQLAHLMTKTAQDVKKLDVVGPCFGHAGDGNFHCILPIRDDDSDEYRAKLHQVNDNLLSRTIEAGGTCTGEHGIGYGKMTYLRKQYGTGAIDMMKRIKVALDPNNIMNPGKVVQPDDD